MPEQPQSAITAGFRQVSDDIYEATLQVSEPAGWYERLKRVIFGPPIPESMADQERLNQAQALAILSSDALSSVAYATESSLAVLVTAGAAALSANLGIGLVIALLMLIVATSYRQTIHAYPNGGGSYTVASDNLGVIPGLIAAAALLIDYLLTVSVSVSSGIDAIASAFPAITPLKLACNLSTITFITVMHLRGMRQSGTLFIIPTYLFLGSFGFMLLAGITQAWVHGGLTHALPPITTLPVKEPLSAWLVLTAFASGCAAMTGVEAIANGVPAFRGKYPPEQAQRAARTLAILITLLVTFFLGTTYLAWRIGAVPFPHGTPTVTAQIAQFAFPGPGKWLFYLVQTGTLLILLFAANTSFADFPRLAAMLARDRFLPVLFTYRGERLAFTVGIGTLGVLSALVVWIFQGSVTGLINLYALGVFTAFTLSQTGMVVHWLHHRDERTWRRRLVMNGIGACATGIVVVVIALAKFDRGAWVVVLVIPLLVFGFLSIRAYYHLPRVLLPPPTLESQVDVVIMPIFSHQDVRGARRPPQSDEPQSHEQMWPGVVAQELAVAARLAREIWIVRVVSNHQEADAYCQAWKDYLTVAFPDLRQRVHIEALISPFRTVVLPLVQFILWQRQERFAGKTVAVLLPREVHTTWWEWPLLRRVASRVRRHLEQHQTDVHLVDLPYTLGSRAAER